MRTPHPLPGAFRFRPATAALLALALALLAGACSGTQPAGGHGGSADRITGAQFRFGRTPVPDKAVTYQPDVVLIGGGANAVRSVSADGLTWTLRGDAPGVDKLAPGKIMFATDIGVGRVLAVSDSGGGKAVTIGPVGLTDVIRDASLGSGAPVPLGSMIAYSAPARPGNIATMPGPGDPSPSPEDPSPSPEDPSPSPEDPSTSPDDPSTGPSEALGLPSRDVIALPPTRIVAMPAGVTVPGAVPVPAQPVRADDLPAPARTLSTTNLDAYSMTPFCCAGGLGVHVTYSKNGLKLTGNLKLYLDQPTVTYNLEIRGGRVTTADVELHGGAGIGVDLDAVSASGLDGNVHNQRVQVPVDVSIPIFGLPIPLSVNVSQAFSLNTAFSTKASRLTAAGDYSFGGTLGFGLRNGSFGVHAPVGVSAKQPFITNIVGQGAGAMGLILAYQVKMSLGIGAFGFTAGLWFAFDVAVGLSAGSSLAPVDCHGASLSIGMKYGIGWSIPQPVADLINFFLKVFQAPPIRASGGPSGSSEIYDKSDVQPHTNACV